MRHGSPHFGCPVIIGGGLAGLTTALAMQRPCIVVTPGPAKSATSSYLAQGGVAAALGQGDSIALHIADTLAAGAGLCDTTSVHSILSQTQDVIETLSNWGVPFARNAAGTYDLHKEAAHQAHRILHAAGDGTGRAIMETLLAQVARAAQIIVMNDVSLEDIATNDGHVVGVALSNGVYLETSQCILASGGTAGLYPVTTNPRTHTGIPIALAMRAGAAVMDLEFMQFHPTACAVGHEHGRCLLISEAVRGAGAQLVDAQGRAFIDPLQPRDIVARAVAMQARGGHCAYLDARGLFKEGFASHFPLIAKGCQARGINADTDLIPITPAAHYLMGGVKTDLDGRTTLPGLWACGEVAATGLHGANRLASNSLLEACVMGLRVGRALANLAIDCPVNHPAAQRRQIYTARDCREAFGNALGLVRDASTLKASLKVFMSDYTRDHHALIGATMAIAALKRCESRGSHWRQDAPGMDVTRHSVLTLQDLENFASQEGY